MYSLHKISPWIKEGARETPSLLHILAVNRCWEKSVIFASGVATNKLPLLQYTTSYLCSGMIL